MKIIFPPRPKGKMLSSDLDYYEKSGKWIAQRKFRGSRAVVHISTSREVTLGNRHGKQFSKFSLDKNYRQEIVDSLHLEANKEYWLDGELMNKDVNATNEIIFYDVLQAGRYLFGNPNQMERIQILDEICGKPRIYVDCNIPEFAYRVSPRIRMAETFNDQFTKHFAEAEKFPQLEGLVLRKRDSALDNFGQSEYLTANLIRCRKAFAVETPKLQRSGGYEF